MNETITIRRGEEEDAEVIAGFNVAMARETEGRELDPERLLAGVRAVFADPSRGRYHVARAGGRIIGSLLITPEWSDWRNGTFWWVQSVYVDPEWRRKGIYRGLYHHVTEQARATEGICGVRLYVERENVIAQQVYEALGMTRTSYQLFEEDFVL